MHCSEIYFSNHALSNTYSSLLQTPPLKQNPEMQRWQKIAQVEWKERLVGLKFIFGNIKTFIGKPPGESFATWLAKHLCPKPKAFEGVFCYHLAPSVSFWKLGCFFTWIMLTLMHASKAILNLPTSSLHLCSPFQQNRKVKIHHQFTSFPKQLGQDSPPRK